MKLKPVFVVCALALAITSVAGGAALKTPAAPTGLRAFDETTNEPVGHTYTMMPAFAWDSVRGASQYEFQLATSRVFSDATVLYNASYTAPVASVQLQVPWMTGDPYALWAHVRVIADGRASSWSKPFGFNTSWDSIPKQVVVPKQPDGLIHWTTVAGATGYEVWFQEFGHPFMTRTNVADEREYWTFHPGMFKTVHWRVRAVRVITAPASLPNGIQAVKYGPYTKVFTTDLSGALSAAPIKAVVASSDADSTVATTRAHQLMPGLVWTGTQDAAGQGAAAQLWRAYVFSDQKCVNPVMTGSLVGGPAWAPRESDPLNMPTTAAELLVRQASPFPTAPIPLFAPQAGVFTVDGFTLTASEELSVAPAAGAAGAAPAAGSPPASGSGASPRQVSLPDNGWPEGRYWWTVVPVRIVNGASSLEYHDLALPQDQCEKGYVWRFGMQSVPLTTSAGSTPRASGLVNSSRVVSAAHRQPSFRELPVITWAPALAAQSYEIELSRHVYPWVAAKKQTSVVTSAVLPLSKSDRGVWYYRVRGLNPNLVGPAQKLTWSEPVPIRITGDIFKILKK